MKILSWNILANEWITKKNYKETEARDLFNRRERFKHISIIIENNNPDIILLQEVMKHEYESLIKWLTHDFYISPLYPTNWEGEYGESGTLSLFKKIIYKYNS